MNHVAPGLAVVFRNERDGPVSGREQRAKPECNGVAEAWMEVSSLEARLAASMTCGEGKSFGVFPPSENDLVIWVRGLRAPTVGVGIRFLAGSTCRSILAPAEPMSFRMASPENITSIVRGEHLSTAVGFLRESRYFAVPGLHENCGRKSTNSTEMAAGGWKRCV